MNGLAKLESPGAFALAIARAREQLEQCRSYSDAKEIRDGMRALEVYARARDDGEAAGMHAAALVLKAEACMGRILKAVPKRKKGQRNEISTGADLPPSNEQLGVDNKGRDRLVTLGELDDEGTLDKRVNESIAAGQWPTRKAILEGKPHVTNNSGKVDWYTPPEWLALAREVLGEIDLDPASSAAANEHVGANRYFDAEGDGLDPERKWRGHVWMNPPYDSACAAFIERLVSEFEAGNVTEAIVLVNNSTDSQWGQRLLSAAGAICFPSGRISFVDGAGGPSKSPLQGQMFCYLGKRIAAFRNAFGPKGVVLS